MCVSAYGWVGVSRFTNVDFPHINEACLLLRFRARYASVYGQARQANSDASLRSSHGTHHRPWRYSSVHVCSVFHN